MAKVTSFDKQNLGAVRAKINAALEAVEQEFGIKIDIGNISYMADSFKTTLTAVVAKGAVADPLFSDVPAQYVKDLIKWKGQAAVGKKVKIGGQDAVIVGIKNRSYIFKYDSASSKGNGLRRISFTNGDALDCQVTGRPAPMTFDAILAASRAGK